MYSVSAFIMARSCGFIRGGGDKLGQAEGIQGRRKELIEQWRREYNQVRPHSSLGYWSPASEARIPVTLTEKVVSFMGAGQS